ncbi:hypothetical protein M0811_14703 [Anaeramoeba ignava]|uniref:Uncharacterized protein n=1 Tax=Anaeramoeba ignava TaxID=1746090 RepID=A0A9Q0LVR4_ANAIG|nr:hypothetical protein M0811_14703 [Anaeramoeba ignava]
MGRSVRSKRRRSNKRNLEKKLQPILDEQLNTLVDKFNKSIQKQEEEEKQMTEEPEEEKQVTKTHKMKEEKMTAKDSLVNLIEIKTNKRLVTNMKNQQKMSELILKQRLRAIQKKKKQQNREQKKKMQFKIENSNQDLIKIEK